MIIHLYYSKALCRVMRFGVTRLLRLRLSVKKRMPENASWCNFELKIQGAHSS